MHYKLWWIYTQSHMHMHMQSCTYLHKQTHCVSDQGCNVSASPSESGINLWEWDQSLWPFPGGNLRCSIAHYFDSERAAFPALSWLDWASLYCRCLNYPPLFLVADSGQSLTDCSFDSNSIEKIVNGKIPQNRIPICYWVIHNKHLLCALAALWFQLCGHLAL